MCPEQLQRPARGCKLVRGHTPASAREPQNGLIQSRLSLSSTTSPHPTLLFRHLDNVCCSDSDVVEPAERSGVPAVRGGRQVPRRCRRGARCPRCRCAGLTPRPAGGQDLQLPPAFALPSDEAISRAIELAYERDFSQLPYAPLSLSPPPPREPTPQRPRRAPPAARLHRRRRPQAEVGGRRGEPPCVPPPPARAHTT